MRRKRKKERKKKKKKKEKYCKNEKKHVLNTGFYSTYHTGTC